MRSETDIPRVKRVRSPAWTFADGKSWRQTSFANDDNNHGSDRRIMESLLYSSKLHCRGVVNRSSAPLEKKVPKPPYGKENLIVCTGAIRTKHPAYTVGTCGNCGSNNCFTLSFFCCVLTFLCCLCSSSRSLGWRHSALDMYSRFTAVSSSTKIKYTILYFKIKSFIYFLYFLVSCTY